MPPVTNRAVHFGAFLVTPQVFHTTSHSFALVNLKPLLPGHVLVSPLRRASRFSELTSSEVCDLFLTVQRVSRMIERVYKASALNIAIQDGPDAGQSVDHVHAHIIPRRQGDMDNKGGNDAIYSMMESEEGNVGKHLERKADQDDTPADGIQGDNRGALPGMDAEYRKPRSDEEMRKEAKWLASEMDKESDG